MRAASLGAAGSVNVASSPIAHPAHPLDILAIEGPNQIEQAAEERRVPVQ